MLYCEWSEADKRFHVLTRGGLIFATCNSLKDACAVLADKRNDGDMREQCHQMMAEVRRYLVQAAIARLNATRDQTRKPR